MGTCQHSTEITDAAIEGFARLIAATGARFITYGREDGGLICEDRTSRARPRLWRILPSGRILPDSRYSFTAHRFTAGADAQILGGVPGARLHEPER